MKHVILLILLIAGVWAQEIGVPYVDTREAVAQSAVLSPDGETFYTYANNTLTHWSLNPVKVLESVKIESTKWGLLKIIPTTNRVLFAHLMNGIAIYDLKNGKKVNQYNIKLQDAEVIGSNIITVDKERNITLLDSQNLTILKTIKLPLFNTGAEDSHDTPLGILKSKNENTVTLITGNRIVVLKSQSLEIIKEIYSSFDSHGYVSSDCKNIVGAEFSYDFDHLQLNKIKKQDKLYAFPILHERFFGHFGCFANKNLLNFYQFESNQWLIITPDGYFDGSPEARKFLYMKTPSGESVPIDDTTFQKYHTQINLKD